MATCPPRQKLFETTTTTSTFLFLCFITVFLWLTLVFSTTLASGEVSDFPGRVPRSLVRLDGDDDYMAMNSYNNPTILEGGQGRSSGDGYETLRQMSLASTQSFIRRRLFNTSVALTVPLFSFTLPQRGVEGSTVDLANQAIFGLFALLVVMLVFAVPVLFTGVRPFNVYGRSNDADAKEDILSHLMKSEHYINFMGAEMKNKIGLNPDKCLQKSICDAHRNPKKYGLLGVPFLLFFPPPSPDKEAKSISIYQKAAKTGVDKKSECWSKYNCFFDFLDLAVYFVDWFNPPPVASKHDGNLEVEETDSEHETEFKFS